MQIPTSWVGRWVELPANINGTVMHVQYQPDGTLRVRKTISPAIMAAIKEDCASQRDIWKKGVLIGKTQRHRLPVASLPAEVVDHCKRKWGDPKKDPDAAKQWKKKVWNNGDWKAFRTSEHVI